MTLMKIQQKPQALAHYQACLRLEPDNQNVQYIVDALSGKNTPKHAPQQYVEALFDSYADKFEVELLEIQNEEAPAQ